MSKYFLFFFFILLNYIYASYPEISDVLKQKRIYPMGEKIYKMRCKKIDLKSIKTYDELGNKIVSQKLCKPLGKKHLEALMLYLWDTQKVKNTEVKYSKLSVTKKEKCPVCGMFLYKYPSWISVIYYKDTKYGFDGMKDLMKYYFVHQKNIVKILTQDYYTNQTINAKDAFFVIGSNVYGPMGHEFIPFKDQKSADRFMFDHKGKRVLKFKDITTKIVESLDE